jgi:16S rRNA (guanine527-N7)-methyltransferase
MSAQIILDYFPKLTEVQTTQIKQLETLYKEWNERINVISRKDFEHFYERHVLHALSIAKFLTFKDGSSILDLGTGGGFPGIPLAILFPTIHFTLIDGIGKKIMVVEEIVAALGFALKEKFEVSDYERRIMIYNKWHTKCYSYKR